MLTELIGQMQTVMRLTHEVVGDISTRLGALENKVESVDVEWKKEVAEVQLAVSLHSVVTIVYVGMVMKI